MEKNKKNVKEIIKKVFMGIAIAITAVLVFVASWLCVDKFIYKSVVPSFMGYSSLTVVSPSMSGTIEKGDFIIIKDTGDYKIGDIVTYIHEGEKIPTTHRIIQIEEGGKFVTKGDFNDSEDLQRVTKDEIFGEVVSVWHNFGVFVGWLLNGGGFIYIIALFLIVILSIYLFKKPKMALVVPQEEINENQDVKAVEPESVQPVVEIKEEPHIDYVVASVEVVEEEPVEEKKEETTALAEEKPAEVKAEEKPAKKVPAKKPATKKSTSQTKKKSEPKPKKAEVKVEKELKEPKTEVKKTEPKKEAEAITKAQEKRISKPKAEVKKTTKVSPKKVEKKQEEKAPEVSLAQPAENKVDDVKVEKKAPVKKVANAAAKKVANKEDKAEEVKKAPVKKPATKKATTEAKKKAEPKAKAKTTNAAEKEVKKETKKVAEKQTTRKKTTSSTTKTVKKEKTKEDELNERFNKLLDYPLVQQLTSQAKDERKDAVQSGVVSPNLDFIEEKKESDANPYFDVKNEKVDLHKDDFQDQTKNIVLDKYKNKKK